METVFEGGYNDDRAFMFFGSPGNPIPTNGGMGLRFTNVTLSGADTINAARISLVKDTTEWYTVNWRLAVVDADNTPTFSSGNPPGSRAIVAGQVAAESLNANHTDGSTYTFPTTAPLQATLGAAIAAVLARGGWASGNALAVVNQSDQDAGAQTTGQAETFSTWDAPTALAPQLIIDYTAGAGGGVSVTPSPATLALASIAPTTVLGSLSITPAARSMALATVNPTVTLGSVSVTPSPATMTLATVAPTVQGGSLTVTPSPAMMALASVAPTVVLGSLALTPAPATTTLASVAPQVILGSVSVTPAAVTVALGTVAPSLIWGSTSATPSPATLALATLVGAVSVADASAPGTVAWTVLAPTATLAAARPRATLEVLP